MHCLSRPCPQQLSLIILLHSLLKSPCFFSRRGRGWVSSMVSGGVFCHADPILRFARVVTEYPEEQPFRSELIQYVFGIAIYEPRATHYDRFARILHASEHGDPLFHAFALGSGDPLDRVEFFNTQEGV